jgi:hypothetical protein
MSLKIYLCYSIAKSWGSCFRATGFYNSIVVTSSDISDISSDGCENMGKLIGKSGISTSGDLDRDS